MKRAPGAYVGLTAKQAELLSYLRYSEAEGFTPSFTEMAAACALASKSGVHRLVSSLEERGYVTRLHGRARALFTHPVARTAETRQPAITPASLSDFPIEALVGEIGRRLAAQRVQA